MINEEHNNQTTSSKSRRQKSTQERLDDKVKQLEKAQESQEALQKKIKTLKDDIAILESKRQQEIMVEYGIDLQDLEAILATHKEELGGER
ncbi:hypothetical protein HKO46_02825 [Streptococcus equi subsp. zooepidemicus]|uniref:hypothetical protein n=1 Tax=Streptococcus equi TaxID=1336 RepID=UPI0002175AEC|nr:hypothetical protein [Streptococcus equi]AEJ26064.1 conserved hypothetical protein [Streptococcus equi subsp. zooepidemicus ATCC 35246]AIA68512.1 hypothetical protein Q426_00180 [Streptococcus equi subsp. zooepidemicus CY]MBR7683819.1 hypothetical protein [Streptococcus equi subsp. zooepidemicus]MBR7752676.1 hypothetical protein [Streptococcus equi subsp. zooepidemicus]MBR7775706.1 hypothetical protein [Streptococcus equi subsp. zooepidemicus]